MVILYLSSALLHGLKVSAERRMWLNRADHMAIFLLIAGTYTPIVYNLFPAAWRWPVLLSVWAIALIGMGFKLLSRRIHGFYNAAIYIILGWGSVLPFLLATNIFDIIPRPGFALLLLGGLIYSVGFLVYYRQWPDPWPELFGHHEIWHLFVMGGSACHYLFMFWVVVPFARETAVLPFPLLT
jgi:hemolysin III